MTDDGTTASTVGERLKAAIADAGMTVRGYARLRAEREHGPAPTFQQIESKRRQLGSWIANDRAISDRNAVEISHDLGKPADFFKTQPTRTRRREELAELRELVAGLADRLDDLERLVLALREQADQRPRRAGRESQR